MFSLECKTEKGKHCIFPFEFRGKKYNACTVDYSKKKKWCATAVHRNGTVIKNNWGYCVMDYEGKIYFHFLYIYKSADDYVWDRWKRLLRASLYLRRHLTRKVLCKAHGGYFLTHLATGNV